MACKNELMCTNKDRYCSKCSHNPNATLEDYFYDRGYIPACGHGYDDCIHDPARRVYEYHNGNSWVRDLYTLDKLEEALREGCCCEGGEYYDDEDK